MALVIQKIKNLINPFDYSTALKKSQQKTKKPQRTYSLRLSVNIKRQGKKYQTNDKEIIALVFWEVKGRFDISIYY